MHVRTATIRRLALGGFAALILAACQTTLTLNTENLENVIKVGIEQQNAANGVTVSAVDCPDRPLLQGDIFDCTATIADGRTLTVTVTQTDATGNVDWLVTATN